MRRVVAPIVVAFALAGCGESHSEDELFEVQYGDLITKVRYCNYGAVSGAQFNGCVNHVDAEEIVDRAVSNRPTAAELYAIGDLNRCLADAARQCSGETREQTAEALETR